MYDAAMMKQSNGVAKVDGGCLYGGICTGRWPGLVVDCVNDSSVEFIINGQVYWLINAVMAYKQHALFIGYDD